MSEKEKIYVPAGFWIRGLSRLIDWLIIAIFSNLILYFSIKKTTLNYDFKHFYLFYIWSISTAVLVFLIFVGIPLITKGRSIGSKIVGIKVISTQNNIYKAIINREILFGVAWTCIIIMVTIIINHTLIFKLAKKIPNGSSFTSFDQARISIVIMISSILLLTQCFIAMTIIPNKNKLGIHDKLSFSMVIRKERSFDIKKEAIQIKSRKVKNVIVEWTKGTYE